MQNLNKIIMILLIIAASVFAALYFFFPREEIKLEKKYTYLPGEPVVFTHTFLEYKEIPDVKLPAEKVIIEDGKCEASTHFDLGTDSLGVKGLVMFADSMFSFSAISFRYPHTIDSVLITDTLKIEIPVKVEVNKPFWKDPWFYASVAITGLAVATRNK